MPIDFQAVRNSVVTWFKSRKNTAIFFGVILVAGITAGFFGVPGFSKPPKYNGDASLECLMAQPDGEFYRVVEFFLLTCPYCERLEPHLAAIKDGVVRRHLVVNRSQEDMARFVFALGKLGRTDLIHAAEISVLDGKGVFIYESEDAREFASSHHLVLREMELAHNSGEADQFIAETRAMQNACRVLSVPLLMRAGNLVSPADAGGYGEAVKKVMPPTIASLIGATPVDF